VTDALDGAVEKCEIAYPAFAGAGLPCCNDNLFIVESLRARPQGADSQNRAAISTVAIGLFQQPVDPGVLALVFFRKIRYDGAVNIHGMGSC
jgi:hypothetical protein